MNLAHRIERKTEDEAGDRPDQDRVEPAEHEEDSDLNEGDFPLPEDGRGNAEHDHGCEDHCDRSEQSSQGPVDDGGARSSS